MSSDWSWHDLWFWQHVKLIDGTTQRGGSVMRKRSPYSEWTYRKPTGQERDEHFYMLQW